MSTDPLARVLPVLLRELVEGSPDPGARTLMLNQGDPGMMASLDRLPAADASRTHGDGASIAAHVDHLRYGLSILNAWARGSLPPKGEMDWTASWKRIEVSDEEWRALRDELRREAAEWARALGTPRQATDREVGWMAGSVAHLAYHLGAIRQMDRALRGPTAEDEARAQAAAG